MLTVLPGLKGEIAVNISDFWADQQGIGVRGWVSAESGPPDDLEFVYEGAVVPVTSWHERQDIAREGSNGIPRHGLGVLVLLTLDICAFSHDSAPRFQYSMA